MVYLSLIKKPINSVKQNVMGITNWQRTIIFVLFISVHSLTFSQNSKSPDLVKVRLSVVAKGIPYSDANSTLKNECYFALATITNVQDTAIEISFPDCAWPLINWVTSTDNVFLANVNCDAQKMENVTLQPNGTIEFSIALSLKEQTSKVESVKIGFNYNSGSLKKYDRDNPGQLIVWSNEVKLVNNLNTYRIRD
jgi:hypothetical protein